MTSMQTIFVRAALTVSLALSAGSVWADPPRGICNVNGVYGPLYSECLYAHAAADVLDHLNAEKAALQEIASAAARVEAAIERYNAIRDLTEPRSPAIPGFCGMWVGRECDVELSVVNLSTENEK